MLSDLGVPMLPPDLADADPRIQDAVHAAYQSVLAVQRDAQVAAAKRDEAWVRLAKTAFANGYYELAADTCTDMLLRHGNTSHEVAYIGFVAQWYDGRQEMATGGFDWFQRRTGIEITYPPARRRHAQWMLERGELDQATQLLQTLVEDHPDIPGARVLLAAAFLQNDRTDDARSILDALLDADPDNAYAWSLRGQVARRDGDAGKIAICTERGGPKPDTWPDPWIDSMGEFVVGASQLSKRALLGFEQAGKEALPLLVKAIDASPDHVGLRLAAADCYRQLGRPADAVQVLRQLDLSIERSTAFHRQLGASEVMLAKSGGRNAAAHATQALESLESLERTSIGVDHVRDHELHTLRAHACLVLEQLDIASDHFGAAAHAAMLQSLDDTPFHLEIALIRMKQQRWKDARSILEQLHRESDETIEVLPLLTITRANDGDAVGAREMLEHWRSLTPDDSRIDAIARQLEGVGG